MPVPRLTVGSFVQDHSTRPFPSARLLFARSGALLAIPIGVTYRMAQFAPDVVCTTTLPLVPGEPPTTDTNWIAVPSMTTIVAVFVGVGLERVIAGVELERVITAVTRVVVALGFNEGLTPGFAGVIANGVPVADGRGSAVAVGVALGRLRVGVSVGNLVKVGVSVGVAVTMKSIWTCSRGFR